MSRGRKAELEGKAVRALARIVLEVDGKATLAEVVKLREELEALEIVIRARLEGIAVGPGLARPSSPPAAAPRRAKGGAR